MTHLTILTERKNKIQIKKIRNKRGNMTTKFTKIKDYKEYKMKSIDGLIKSISESNLKYLEEIF